MTVKARIEKTLIEFKELSVNEMLQQFHVSKQMIHIALKKLVEEKKVMKLGAAPKTIYRIAYAPSDTAHFVNEIDANSEENKFLNKHFLLVSDTGNLQEGYEAFVVWCQKRNLPIEKTLSEFIKTKKQYLSYFTKIGFIDGTDKLRKTKEFETIELNKLFYLDFYAIERFGKTRLGTLLHYAKQGQNKYLMNIMMREIESGIKSFITEKKVDAVAFIPPTVRREVQIMKFIQQKLNMNIPILNLKKINGIIPIPQKSLSKMNDRIRNAENTFSVQDNRKFKHVLLIDDAVGSGATLNQIAEKIKRKKITNKVTGLAIVGSFKGFDVLTDV